MKIRNNYNIREIAGVTVLVPSSVVGKSGVNTASLNATGLWLLKAIPADRQPSFALMMKWDISAQAIREMYSLRLKAARDIIVDRLHRRGII